MFFFSDRQGSIISLILKVLLLVLAVITLLKGEYVWFIGVSFSLVLTSIPSLLARDFSVRLPLVFDLSITLSIFLHVVGGYGNWYESIPYYDHLTHFVSSVTVSLIGLMMLYLMIIHFEVAKVPPLVFGFFTVMFAMAMGVVWEFLEWGFDIIFGTELQRGLNDTMLDFVFDTTAGVVVGAIATTTLKKAGKFEYKMDIFIGDIKESKGYQRWQLLTDKHRGLKEKIQTSFHDPIVLDSVFDFIVAESKHISKAEKRIWHGFKEKMHKKENGPP